MGKVEQSERRLALASVVMAVAGGAMFMSILLGGVPPGRGSARSVP
jgi:hypothetical protein